MPCSTTVAPTRVQHYTTTPLLIVHYHACIILPYTPEYITLRAIGVSPTACKDECGQNLPRLGSVGYAQTIPGIYTSGITLQRTSVSSAGHLYPYPELRKVLYDIPTRARNFWKFCTSVPQIPGVRVHHFYSVCEFCTPVPQYPQLL